MFCEKRGKIYSGSDASVNPRIQWVFSFFVYIPHYYSLFGVTKPSPWLTGKLSQSAGANWNLAFFLLPPMTVLEFEPAMPFTEVTYSVSPKLYIFCRHYGCQVLTRCAGSLFPPITGRNSLVSSEWEGPQWWSATWGMLFFLTDLLSLTVGTSE